MNAFLDQIIKDNQKFIEEKKYENFITNKFPNKKIAIITCMDTRLTHLLPAALNLENGDVKMIKNAGGVITDSFGSEMKALVIAVYDLGVEDILVIGHTDCGACAVNPEGLKAKMLKRGITKETLQKIENQGIDLDKWLAGFDSTEDGVIASVKTIENHPLIPKDIKVYGYVIDTLTGELLTVEEPLDI